MLPSHRPGLSTAVLAAVFASQLWAVQSIGPRSLDGVKLRCCVLLEPPVTLADDNSPRWGNVSGLAIDYLRQLQDDTGFQCESLGVYKPPAPEFEEFSGFVRYMDSYVKPGGDYSDCVCQLGVAGFCRNPIRNAQVDFVAPFLFGTLGMVENISTIENGSMSRWFAFQPFVPEVWGLLALTLVLFMITRAVCKWILSPSPREAPLEDSILSEPLGNRLGKITRVVAKRFLHVLGAISDSFLWVMFCAIGVFNSDSDQERQVQVRVQAVEPTHMPNEDQPPAQPAGPNLEPNTEQGRVRPVGKQHDRRWWFLNLMAMMVGLFFVILYEAALVVIIFELKPKSRYGSLVDLTNCKIEASKVCLASGGVTEVFWNETIQAARKSCRKGSLENDQPIRVEQKNGLDPYTLGVESVADPDSGCEFFMGSTALIQVAADTRYCGKIAVVGEPFYFIACGFVAARGSNFTDALSRTTLELQEKHKIERAVEYGTKCRKCDQTGNSGSIAGWIRPVFYIIFIALLVFLVLNIIFR